MDIVSTKLNEEASINLKDKRDLPIFEDDDDHLQNYLPTKLASEHFSRLTPAAGIAVRHSKRMQAQHSVFTVTHRDQIPLEIVGNGKHIGRYIIPSFFKPRIRRQLEALKIDRLSVFPELDNAARSAETLRWMNSPSKVSPELTLVVYSERKEIELEPEYQRISGIWTHEKRQLLIDSLVNGFDVPKLYFHEFVPPKQKGAKKYRYAIIDGKQRLQTIWDFIDGNLPLAEDFKYLRDDNVNAGGLDYPTLAKKYPQIKARLDATPLDIVTIRTNDIELIEDMFSRLNEAVPLNAPEKRGALGGPLPPVIKKVADHAFFRRHIPFQDARYRHRDLAAKSLY